MFSATLSLSRWIFILALIVPVGAGVLGVILPALSYFPAIGETEFSLDAFDALGAVQSLPYMIALSLFTGLSATFLALFGTLAMLAVFYQTTGLQWIQRLLSPVLVIPHAAAAIAVGFLIAPSGWPVRLISPALTGWSLPPVFSPLHDAMGIAVIVALTLKALPFILLMALSVLAQPHLSARLNKQLNLAVTMGYHPASAFLKVAWPMLYPAIRLPVIAMLAFATANVEIPLVLGPGSPPTLAVAVLQWFNHIDITMRLQASAAACLQVVVTCSAVLFWLLSERVGAGLISRWQLDGNRVTAARTLKGVAVVTVLGILTAVMLMLASLTVWSFAAHWPFPQALPDAITVLHWASGLTSMQTPLTNTLLLAVPVSLGAVLLSILVLEYEKQRDHCSKLTDKVSGDLLLFIPLLIPGVAFLFGLTWLAQLAQAGQWLPTYVSHFVYVLPYVFLSLAVAYRRFDERYRYVAYGLGASPYNVFVRVTLPLLSAPIAIAFALGLAISFSQYLATLLPGAGAIATITTESVAVSAGGSRRLSAVYTLMQMILPLAGFVLAWWLPAKWFNPAVHSR